MKKLSKNQLLVDEVTSQLVRSLKRNLYTKEGRGTQKNIFFISDPVFPSLQRDSKAKDLGRYSCGFYLDLSQKAPKVGFCNSHIRSSLEAIRRNSEEGELLVKILKRIQRERYYFGWSSKQKKKESEGLKHIKEIEHSIGSSLLESIQTYLECGPEDIAQELNNDLAPQMPNTYKKNSHRSEKGMRGTDLRILVELEQRSARHIVKKLRLVEEIFLAVYPKSVGLKRNSGYRKMLIGHHSRHGIKISCAHKRCDVQDENKLEAAHLTPVCRGGNDHINNLIFLCKKHHRKQEGRSLSEQLKMLKSYSFKHTKLRR